MKRSNIKGFTIKLFGFFVEFVFIGVIPVTIAVNYKRLDNNTFYILDW